MELHLQKRIFKMEVISWSNFFAVYRKNDKNENIKKLIDWILSPEGQRIIDDNGYVSLRK